MKDLIPHPEVTNYYAVKLTSEEAKKIEHKEMTFFEVNGRTIFELLDADGKPTGEYVFYVIFK